MTAKTFSFNPDQYCGPLQKADDGIWYSPRTEKVSYPELGHTNCFQIEENSLEMLEKYPGRYQLEILNYERNLRNLNEIYRILTEHARADLDIVVTVPPVPIMVTYRSEDVVVSNTYSKSTLRAVAED